MISKCVEQQKFYEYILTSLLVTSIMLLKSPNGYLKCGFANLFFYNVFDDSNLQRY